MSEETKDLFVAGDEPANEAPEVAGDNGGDVFVYDGGDMPIQEELDLEDESIKEVNTADILADIRKNKGKKDVIELKVSDEEAEKLGVKKKVTLEKKQKLSLQIMAGLVVFFIVVVINPIKIPIFKPISEPYANMIYSFKKQLYDQNMIAAGNAKNQRISDTEYENFVVTEEDGKAHLKITHTNENLSYYVVFNWAGSEASKIDHDNFYKDIDIDTSNISDNTNIELFDYNCLMNYEFESYDTPCFIIKFSNVNEDIDCIFGIPKYIFDSYQNDLDMKVFASKSI